MNRSMMIQKQLVGTKFFVPVVPGSLIYRQRLSLLLDQILIYPFTLLSSPAGFGKTTLLSTWVRSQPASNPLIAWISLDEEDNDPELFWTYVLSALDAQQPERFALLLKSLQSAQASPLTSMLTALTNIILDLDSPHHFLVILDDYHLITEPQVHTTLLYLLEHMPPQFHIIMATRTDPPLPLSHLRVRRHMLEIRADQLRCTVEETGAFFKEVVGSQLPHEAIREVRARTEGWLVGLQLLGLSLPRHTDPVALLEEATGDQRYILDYLTEEVLEQQPQDVQLFLLCTSILERLTASLCDTVMEQTGSQKMLERLERANLFVVSLDKKRQWYRYHALFAESLRYRLEQTQPDLEPLLHYRASLWYAEHDQITEAILHAFHAHQWDWAATLIERKTLPLVELTWGVGQYKLVQLRQWLEQLPPEVMRSRPRLCLGSTELLWAVASPAKLQAWLGMAEAMLTTSLTAQTHEDPSHPTLTLAEQKEQENFLGEVLAFHAILQSFDRNGQAALTLGQQALDLLSADRYIARTHVVLAQLMAYYASSTNDAEAAIQSGQQGILIAQEGGLPALAISLVGTTVMHLIGTGRLHEALQMVRQGIQLGRGSQGQNSPDVGWPIAFQADILREWNQLDEALSLVKEAISLCEQVVSILSLMYLLAGYTILLRICLSRRELDAASSAFQQLTDIGMRMNQPWYNHQYSFFTTVDQIKLWLACGELDRATSWIEELDLTERQSTFFAREREEVACARVLLAKKQSALALQRLEPVLERATMGKRWGHVIEVRLLQALAYQIRHQETQALYALSEAVRLAEPEGYIRTFVDEGASMAVLLSRLREEQRKAGPTPYLDTVLAAFPQQDKVRERKRRQRIKNRQD